MDRGVREAVGPQSLDVREPDLGRRERELDGEVAESAEGRSEPGLPVAGDTPGARLIA